MPFIERKCLSSYMYEHAHIVWWMTTKKAAKTTFFLRGCAHRPKPMDLYAGWCKLRKKIGLRAEIYPKM